MLQTVLILYLYKVKQNGTGNCTYGFGHIFCLLRKAAKPTTKRYTTNCGWWGKRCRCIMFL